MTRRGGRPVTVGVVEGQHAALSFAAAQARAAGCELRLVHTYVVPPGPPDAVAVVYGIDVAATFREAGRSVLLDAAAYVAAVHGHLVVQQELREGHPVPVLTALAATSWMVVLGPDDDTPWCSRVFRSRVARALVEASACPAVVVPDSWSPSGPGRDVTLLLDAGTVAHGPLRFAFEQASLHRRDVRLVHVQDVDAVEGDGVPWRDMSRLIEAWRSRYPEVSMHVTVVRAAADLDTVESLEDTDLLVMGRTHDQPGVSLLHRSLAQSVVRHASCPVAVVPADYDG